MVSILEKGKIAMRPRWKKVLSDLFANVVRSLLVVASIAVGLFAIGMIITVYYGVRQDMTASYSKVNPANIWVKAAGFDQDFVDHIRKVAGVKDAEGVWTSGMRVLTGPDTWSQINLMAVDGFDEKNIATLGLVEGKYPPDDKEIVIDTSKFYKLHARVGDYIQIKNADGDIRSFHLVGITHDLTIGAASGGGGYFIAPMQGYITYDTVKWLGQPQQFNQMLVTVSESPNDLDHIRIISDRVLHEFDTNNITTINSVIRRQTDHPTLTYIDAIAAILMVLGILVLFLSAFLITNTLSALLNQQMPQIGVMKTVGGNRIQINGVYFVLIFVYSLIALAISIPLSFYASYGLLEFLSYRINFIVQGHRLIPPAVIVQIITAVIIPQVAGALPILRGTRISIREALSGEGSNQLIEESGIYRFLTKIRGMSRPLAISLRNTFRQKVRLILTLITLILGGATFISTFNVRSSIDAYIVRIRRYFIADVNLTFNEPYRITRASQDILQIPGVKSVEGWASADAEIILANDLPGESVTLYGPPVDSKLVTPTLLQGRWIQTGDQNALVVNELFLKYYPDIKLGDTLTLRVNGDDKDWIVVGVFQFVG
jgi:putative ABC transport system permease protein